MKKTILFLMFVCSFLEAQSGAELFEQKCASCHITAHPSQVDKSQLIAPPAFGVVKHVKEAFNGNKEETIRFIKEYALHPSMEKAKCRPQAIKRFGLMPSQKDLVSEQELELIANYMLDTFSNSKTCKRKK